MESNKELWCDNQVIEKDTEVIICIAHLAEGKAFNCPYESLTRRKESKYPCSEYTKE